MTNLPGPTHSDGLSLAAEIRNGTLTPAEALEHAIERAEQVAPHLNAIAERLYDQARSSVQSTVPDGPFAGVPILTKDLFTPVRGARMTSGSLLSKDLVMPFDSELVTRVRNAGFTIFGTTTSPEFGTSYSTESRLFGATRNPWSLDHTCGGSSGAAAALVAARVLPIAHASDGAGSIRVPASACGVFGLKPSRGLTPMGPAVGEGWAGMSSGHVITVSVRDSAAVLDQIAGADLGAPYAAPAYEGAFLDAVTGHHPKGLRIGVLKHMAPWTSHADCVEAVDRTALLCEQLGHHVEEVQLPINGLEFHSVIFTILATQTRSVLNMMEKFMGAPVDETALDARHRALLRDHQSISGADYAASVDYIHSVGRQLALFFTKYDLLLTPTLAKPPLPVGALEVDENASRLEIIDQFHSFSPFTAPFNASGQPAMSVPLHWNSQGLPIGTQFAAAFGGERRLFSLAAQLEEAAPWKGRLPPLHAH